MTLTKIARPPVANVELVTLRCLPTPCPDCYVPGALARIGRCPRCNGASVVYQGPRPVAIEPEEVAP